MADKKIEQNSPSFSDEIQKALNWLKKWVKEFLAPKKSLELTKEKIISKEQQEAGLATEEILDYKNDILRHNEITNKINKEVVASIKPDLENIKKSVSAKVSIPQYIPKYPDTQQFVEHSQRIAAPYIAQSVDDLHNSVKQDKEDPSNSRFQRSLASLVDRSIS